MAWCSGGSEVALAGTVFAGVAHGEPGGVMSRPCESQKQLVIEFWLSRAFSSSLWASICVRCRFTGLILLSTGRLLSTRFLFGRKIASRSTFFPSNNLCLAPTARVYTLYLRVRVCACVGVRVCGCVGVGVYKKAQMLYLVVLMPSFPKAFSAVLTMDSRA